MALALLLLATRGQAQPAPASAPAPAPAPAPASAPAPAVSGAERWELGVEVSVPVPLAEAPLAAALPEADAAPAVRLDVYDDTGGPTPIYTATVAPSIANPDWRADFDGDDPGADWRPAWASLQTAFLTLELYAVDGSAETLLGRYAYAPTALSHAPGQTGFFRPVAGSGGGAGAGAAAYVEVYTDTTATTTPRPGLVRARAGRTREAFFEDALAGAGAAEAAFVMPYDHGAYALACVAGGFAGAQALRCPEAAADFFLARLPATDPRPSSTVRRFTFAEATPAVILHHDWGGTGGVLVWDVPGLVLAFPEGRRLEVDGTLIAEGVRLTEAVEDEGWGGVVYLSRVPEALRPASVLRGSVVERVRVPSGSGGGVVAPYGAVSVHGRDLVVEGETEIRSGGAGVVGLLATGEAADVAVTGESQIYENGGGGVRATGGAQVVVSGGSEIFDNPGVGVRADGFGTLITLVGASVLDNGGIGVRALSGGEVRFANTDGDPATHVENNAGGLDAGGGGSLDAGQCGPSETAPCDDRNLHVIRLNAVGGHFDARSLTGSTLYAQGNQWHTTDISQLVLVEDASSVLVVCPILGGGACGIDHRLGAAAEEAAEGGAEGGEPLRLQDVLALVDEAERARLAGDAEAFEIAASAAVAAIDTSQVEDARRAAFEVTARLFAWDQPEGPLADLVSLTQQPGEGRPWALRALGVARAASEDYAAARAVADTLASAYSGGEHAAFGLGLAVRVSVLEHDEAAAVAALVALAAAFPEADELGSLAALVVGAFPGTDLSGLRLGALGGGAAAPGATAQASASPVALLVVGAARPNPSAGAAAIPFALAAEARVEAVLYDVLGRRLAVLASGVYAAGRHGLILEESLARRLPSGTYVVYVTARAVSGVERRTGAGASVAVRRLTLTR